MSGGHFQHKQYEFGFIADEVEQMILYNDSNERDEWGDRKGFHFSPETMAEFERGLLLIRQAQIYAQRIDWLVCGDDGEDNFHKRLSDDLAKLERFMSDLKLDAKDD